MVLLIIPSPTPLTKASSGERTTVGKKAAPRRNITSIFRTQVIRSNDILSVEMKSLFSHCICIFDDVGVTLVHYNQAHVGHSGSVLSSNSLSMIPSNYIVDAELALSQGMGPMVVHNMMTQTAMRNRMPKLDIEKYIPSYPKIMRINQSMKKQAIECAPSLGQEMTEVYCNPADPFILDMSFSHEGKNEIFILLATHESLGWLNKHGQNIFYMDGIHNINSHKNNQMVTINVRVGNKGYPCAYLITTRYV
jgi:hypothetical protein